MLAFTSPVPAQVRALHYLEDVAVTFPNAPIRVGGHSKGGNLAFYASVNAKAEVQSRIVLAYSNDGPGFMPEFFLTEGYARIERRLMSFVPQSSIVGVLLHSPKNFHVIHSTQKTILQHDPFSWTVCGPRFRYERSRSAFGVRADVTLDRWITGLSLKERELFIEKMFDLISDSGAKTLTDILSDKVKSIKVIVTSFARLEKKDRDMMFGIMHKLLRAGQESRQLSREMEEESNRLLTESASTPQKKLTLPAMKKKKAPAPKKEKASILPPKKEKATTLPQKKEKKKAPLPKKEKEQIKKAPKKAVASK